MAVLPEDVTYHKEVLPDVIPEKKESNVSL
jgi:hypothetical protein